MSPRCIWAWVQLYGFVYPAVLLPWFLQRSYSYCHHATIWQYIYLENIDIPQLYLSKPRPVVERDGVLIMVDDDRMPLEEGEVPEMRSVRFRTLGCYPLTGAVESEAATLPEVIQEMLLTKTSERQGRVIDHDSAGSMEKKKMEGYF